MNYKTKLQFTFLILAAEIIYALPFVMIRIFRPTLITAFGIDNKSIGTCYSLYGITAVISYFFGGLIADKYQPKYIMCIALLLTGFGGFFWVFYPCLETLYALYIYWGLTSIMLFWSPLIKATRILGGKQGQILSFSILEGGRGIVAALIGVIGILVINLLIPNENSSVEQLQNVMNLVYLITSILIIFIAFLLLLLPDFGENHNIITKNNSTQNIMKVLRLPVIWILMVIILTSYIGYKIAATFTQYASELHGYSTMESTKLGTILSILRTFACLLIISFARKSSPEKWLMISFFIMFLGSLLLVFNRDFLQLSLLLSISIPAMGAFALRALYFTVLEKTRVPLQITGTAVGILSVIGFSPDLFLGIVQGFFLDELGGTNGFQYSFIFFCISSFIGLIASILFYNSIKSRNKLLST